MSEPGLSEAGLQTRVVLVRHGQANAGVNQIVGGPRGCTGLSELGRRQVLALAERWSATGELGTVDVLLSSTLPRAVETATLLALAVGGLDVEPDAGLCEIDPGESDGMGWAEAEEKYGPSDVGLDPFRPLAPGGESWASFGLRVGTTLRRLAAAYAGQVVVAACHGGVIEQSMLNGLNLPAQLPGGWRIGQAPNASITEWVVTVGEGRAQHWQLRRFADAAHLAGIS